MTRSLIVRCSLVALTMLGCILTIGFVEQQAWAVRDWLQFFLFLLFWAAAYVILSWGRSAKKKPFYLSIVITFLISFLLSGVLAEFFFRARTAYIPREVLKSLPGGGEYIRKDMYVYDDAPIEVGRRFHPGENTLLDGQSHEIVTWNGLDRFIYQPTPDKIRVHFVTDENGFRNMPPLKNQYDIVVAGDSFSTGVEVETPWPVLLSQNSEQSVINLAIPGYGSQAESASVRLYGLDKNPKTIIMAYFEGNDLRDAQFYAEARDQNLSLAQYQAAGAPWNRRLVTLAGLRLLAVGLDRLVGLHTQSPERDGLTKPAVYPAEVTINGRRMALSFLDGYTAMLTAQQSEIEASENWRETTAAFLEMQQLAEANNRRFVLVYIPSKPHIYLPLLPVETANAITSTAGRIKIEDGQIIPDVSLDGVPYEAFMAHIDDQAVIVANFAQAHNIEFLDLTLVFQEQAAQGKMLYFSLGTHWNPSGHELAAQTIESYLSSEP
ncbi:MAG: hypothetical protein WAM60_25840 [Candidatus Promineifilaceae bacterium]